jgi:hypothetical protein
MPETIANEVGALERLVAEIKTEAEDFHKGNSAAGTRARKLMMQVKIICHETRAKISKIKSA